MFTKRVVWLWTAVVLVSVQGDLEAQLTPELLRARTEREWAVKAEKMRQHLLPLMREHGIDLWVVLSRENAPDPVV